MAAECSRLDATLLYVGGDSSPSNRMVLANAEGDLERQVNPCTGRLDAGAGRPRTAEGYSDGAA